MKKILLLIGLFLWQWTLFAQNYEANWKSLDQRQIPEWFGDAKFGIFIHWGPYSVPAWSPAGTYTEWYQYWWQTHNIFGNNKPDKDAIPNLQKLVYGEDGNYYDHGRNWKAELYDPTEWAQLFKKAGAKYVILTSKHHDGFTLWKNKEAQRYRGFAWNAVETGPKKDLLAPYMKAMREAGLKAGLYYSLLEWFHPISGKSDFITKHYHPQIKDLVTKYNPDLLYADGEWGADDSYWKSNELIQWLYNQSTVKDNILINDRWFKGCRHKHGGYYSTEYEAEGLNTDKPYEEIRGIGTSFGYNRDEDLADYATSQELILMLCDIVSQGGNLCLNVGPRADGKIPVIQQQRLLEIGSWLDINGDAIYGTKKWSKPCQWSKGKTEINLKDSGLHYITADYIIRLMLEPKEGEARKECIFTIKDDNLYAIFPKWQQTCIIKEIDASKIKNITLLIDGTKCSFKKYKNGIRINLPAYKPEYAKSKDAYVLQIQLK